MSSSGPPWPAAITVRSWPCLIIQILLLLIFCALVGTFLWTQVSVIAFSVVAGLGGILLLYRACRHGVRFDDRGITVRNLLRTHKLSWHDVSRFADGEVLLPQGGEGTPQYFWAVKIVLSSGRSVTAGGTMRWKQRGVSKVLATMEQVATRWQIPAAQLRGTDPNTGPAGLRR
jgi:hypothetical protein